jgi:FMN reductase
MSVLLVAGSPSEQSRSATLLTRIERLLRERFSAREVPIDRLVLNQLSPQALLLADWSHPSIRNATQRVALADVVVIATPVYKAAYSGLLKVFLDVLAQDALKGKTVLPLATGGSPHHMLALDYALRPVLQSLGAKHILPGVYASDSQMPRDDAGAYALGADLDDRLREAVQHLASDKLATTRASTFEDVSFAHVTYAN